MECYVCHKDIDSFSRASSVGVGGGLSLMGHDRCWAALNETASPEPDPKPMGKTINKAIRKHTPPEEVAKALTKELDLDEVLIGSTIQHDGQKYYVGWTRGIIPLQPGQQYEKEKGVR